MTKIKLKTHINPSILTRTTKHGRDYHDNKWNNIHFFATYKKCGHFFACYNEILGTLLHATMKTWTLCCMLQWKFGQFFSPAKTIFCTLFCMQQRNLWDFYFCNKANFPLAPPLSSYYYHENLSFNICSRIIFIRHENYSYWLKD